MPNRRELPIPAMRAKASVAKTGMIMPDADAWTVIAFCVIGWLATFYLAVSSIGADAFSGLTMQIPLG
jgi:hypothetical protein